VKTAERALATPSPDSASTLATGDRQKKPSVSNDRVTLVATHLAVLGFASSLYGSLSGSYGQGIGVIGYRVLLENFLKQVNPQGPLERMMAEQLLMSHHVIGQLYVKAMNATDVDVANKYFGAAARMMSEHRQTTVALRSSQTSVKGVTSTPVAPVASTAAKPTPVPSDPPANGNAESDKVAKKAVTKPRHYSKATKHRIKQMVRG
jgi:hypothetical protein